MSETALKRRVIELMRREFPGIWFFKPHDLFTSGIPDIVGCKAGRFFAVELKFEKNKATRLQRHVIEQIIKAGGAAIVANSVQAVREFLESF